MGLGNPDLRIIPLASIKLQEGVTLQKATSLAHNMELKGQIINPIVVTPLEDGYFFQLDGASRAAALDILDAPWAFVHVVNYNDVSLATWAHVTRMDSSALRRLDDNDPDIILRESRQPQIINEERMGEFDLVAMAMFADGDSLAVYSSGGIIKRVQTANKLIGLYKLKPEQRVDLGEEGIGSAIGIAKNLGSDGVAIEYANFSQREIMQAVAAGELLPPGVTKHRLKERVLMNYPLRLLRSWVLDILFSNIALHVALSKIKFHPYRDEVTFQAEPWE